MPGGQRQWLNAADQMRLQVTLTLSKQDLGAALALSPHWQPGRPMTHTTVRAFVRAQLERFGPMVGDEWRRRLSERKALDDDEATAAYEERLYAAIAVVEATLRAPRPRW